jgi:hypothetical protein
VSEAPVTSIVVPLFRNLHPPADDDVIVDSAAALRSFFGVVDSIASENLLQLRFVTVPKVCGKLFMATAALLTLLGHNRYAISESPAGFMYVATRGSKDAVMLESQVYSSFGGVLSFHRVSTVDREYRFARGEAAAFKFFAYNR